MGTPMYYQSNCYTGSTFYDKCHTVHDSTSSLSVNIILLLLLLVSMCLLILDVFSVTPLFISRFPNLYNYIDAGVHNKKNVRGGGV